MNKLRLTLNIFAVFVMCLICSTLANAQATRTWVSGVGDDANPCSRTAPCKTFAGAISKTATCGEISVLDPGGFGAVTITKSITINGDGTLAGILAAGVNGVIVNGADTSIVILRSISINGACTGLDGIRYLGGKHLHVENCTIYGFTGDGIDAAIGSAHVSELSVTNTSFTNITGSAIKQSVTGVGTLGHSQISNVRINRGGNGVEILNGNSTIAHSFISHLTGDGIKASGVATLNIADVVLDNINGAGINASSSGSTANFANCDIFNNNTGILIAVGATGNRFGNSRIFGNGNNENVLGVLNLQGNR
jgi:parallel beta helix pectate lyase-like protein